MFSEGSSVIFAFSHMMVSLRARVLTAITLPRASCPGLSVLRCTTSLTFITISFQPQKKSGRGNVAFPRPIPLDSGDACHLTEALAFKVQEESTSCPAKAILNHLKNSATTKINILLLYRKGHHGINHVLKDV